jgi:hypothetical protein
MKISDLYGKVIENNQKKCHGYISSAVISGDKIKFLQCFDTAERQFFVDASDVVSIGEKVIYTKKAARCGEGIILKLGRGCYAENGKFLGLLRDCLFDGFTVKKAQIENKSYPFSRIICGDIYIVKDCNGNNTTGENRVDCAICPHKLFINALCN